MTQGFYKDPVIKHLVTAAKKNSPLMGKNVKQNQVLGLVLSCHSVFYRGLHENG